MAAGFDRLDHGGDVDGAAADAESFSFSGKCQVAGAAAKSV